MTVRLLFGSSIQREIKNLMGAGSEAVIAVAYWGEGGGKKTGVLARARENTRILCDLFSGCCNPDEMRKLVKHAEVRTLDGLHAKVWCTPDAAVIGSANASTNGLGLEGEAEKTRGSIEACALVKDSKFAKDLRIWFDKAWTGGKCRPVNGDLIDEAEPIWKARRSGQPPQSSETLMEALGKPDRQVRFGHVRVLAYQRGKLTKKQERVVDVVLRRDYPPEVETVWEGEYPFYLTDKDWNVRPGDIYLDFETAKDGGRFKFYGIYQVRENWRLVVEGQKLVLCNPLLDLAGIRLGKAERRALCKTVREWVVGNDWKTDEQDNYLDMPLTEFLPVGWPNA